MWMQYGITVFVMGIGTVMDMRRKRISRWLPGIYFCAVLLVRGTELMMNGFWEAEGLLAETVQDIGTGMIPGILCLLLSFLTGQAIGYGDSLIVLICGMGLGVLQCIQILMISFAGAGLFGVVLLLTGRADRKKELPFIPFLLLGVLGCIGQNL